MSVILLADDSPHAQRMGERILREEGFEVVSLTDGDTALVRLKDADPDVIVADAFLPGKSGFDICRYVKSHPKHRHVRVIVTAGLLEPFDEQEAFKAGCDGILKKPFEASLLVKAIRPLVAEAQLARTVFQAESSSDPAHTHEIDVERVEAAVTLALEAALPALIREITQRVLVALEQPPEKARQASPDSGP